MLKQWPADVVERRDISTLIPYAKNSRTHSEAQVAQIAASMKEWGWTNPILIDGAGSVIAGHGRLLAARQLGYTEAPVIVKRWQDFTGKQATLEATGEFFPTTKEVERVAA